YPENERLRYMAGLGLEKLKRYDEALLSYAAIKPTSQFYPHALFRSALLLREQKKLEAALGRINELKQNEDVDPDVFILGSNILSDLERFSEAVELTNEGFRRHPKNMQLLFLRGVYEERSGDLE